MSRSISGRRPSAPKAPLASLAPSRRAGTGLVSLPPLRYDWCRPDLWTEKGYVTEIPFLPVKLKPLPGFPSEIQSAQAARQFMVAHVDIMSFADIFWWRAARADLDSLADGANFAVARGSFEKAIRHQGWLAD